MKILSDHQSQEAKVTAIVETMGSEIQTDNKDNLHGLSRREATSATPCLFLVHQARSEKGSSLKGKNFNPLSF